MATKVRIVILVEEDDEDARHSTGMTNEAYERLVRLLPWEIFEGPERVVEE